MTSDTEQEIRGTEMTEEEINSFLVEQGYGILSLASNDDAYAVPISIGYDGEALFMNLITFGAESLKMDYLKTTTECCVVVTEVVDKFDWRCVIVRGEGTTIEADEKSYHEEVLNDNGWFPVIYPPTEAMTDVTRIKLIPTEMSGRKGEAQQDI